MLIHALFHTDLYNPPRPSGSLDRIVNITERFLQSGRLADLLWSYCLQTSLSDSAQLRETLLSRICALPDLTANKLHPNNRPLFSPQQYYPLLAKEMLTALERTCQALRGYTVQFPVIMCFYLCLFLLNLCYVICRWHKLFIDVCGSNLWKSLYPGPQW